MKYAIIHIADIHYRKSEPEGVSTVLESFLQDITHQIHNLPAYKFYLAITGDIVQAGDDVESYENFLKEYNQKFDDIGLPKECRMLVPGNHDVERNTVKLSIQKFNERYGIVSTKEREFNDFIDSEKKIIKKFENYKLFEDRKSVV